MVPSNIHSCTKVLYRFRRYSVFLTTHSDPERGDLHVAPGEQFASAAEQVSYNPTWILI